MATADLPSGRISLHQLPQVGRGRAEEVVMIHGLGANFGFWYASAVQWFRRFGRVTLFDLPGHGESDMPESGYTPARLAEILGEVLDHLGIERAHLIAHSFGGSVALAFAVQQPERVQSLVLADVRLWAVEPATHTEAAAPWLQRLRDVGLELTDRRLDPSVQVLVELARLRLEAQDPGAAVSEVLPGARGLFPGKRSARKWLRLIETTQAYEEMTDPAGLALTDIAAIQQPILAVYGGLSARKRSAMALQRSCPHCQLNLIPNVGHFFPLTRPRLFARPVLAFLRSIARENSGVRRRRPRAPRLQAELSELAREPASQRPAVDVSS